MTEPGFAVARALPSAASLLPRLLWHSRDHRSNRLAKAGRHAHGSANLDPVAGRRVGGGRLDHRRAGLHRPAAAESSRAAGQFRPFETAGLLDHADSPAIPRTGRAPVGRACRRHRAAARPPIAGERARRRRRKDGAALRPQHQGSGRAQSRDQDHPGDKPTDTLAMSLASIEVSASPLISRS